MDTWGSPEPILVYRTVKECNERGTLGQFHSHTGVRGQTLKHVLNLLADKLTEVSLICPCQSVLVFVQRYLSAMQVRNAITVDARHTFVSAFQTLSNQQSKHWAFLTNDIRVILYIPLPDFTWTLNVLYCAFTGYTITTVSEILLVPSWGPMETFSNNSLYITGC